MIGKTFLAGVMAPALVAAGALVAGAANAAIVTDDVTFTGNDIVAIFGPSPATINPVVGEFKISFDPTKSYSNETTGIELVSLNLVLGSPISFNYTPSTGTLQIGGSFAGPRVRYAPSSNDFWFRTLDFPTSPTFDQVGYSQTSLGPENLYETLNQTGSLTVTPTTGVPEPAVWLLTLTGLGLTGGALRLSRRRAAGLATA